MQDKSGQVGLALPEQRFTIVLLLFHVTLRQPTVTARFLTGTFRLWCKAAMPDKECK